MKAKLMLCLCLLLAATTMFAQNLTVTGVVTEKARTREEGIGSSIDYAHNLRAFDQTDTSFYVKCERQKSHNDQML